MNKTITTILSLLMFVGAGINLTKGSSVIAEDDKIDIIFVSIDEELEGQLVDLANYALSTYNNHTDGRITIKIFASAEEDKALVQKLVVLINDLGVDKTHIKVIIEKEHSAKPYFSMSIFSQDDLNGAIGYQNGDY